MDGDLLTALGTLSSIIGYIDPKELRPVNTTTTGPGICDICNEFATQRKLFDQPPQEGMHYCKKCAPGRETDADWPTV